MNCLKNCTISTYFLGPLHWGDGGEQEEVQHDHQRHHRRYPLQPCLDPDDGPGFSDHDPLQSAEAHGPELRTGMAERT